MSCPQSSRRIRVRSPGHGLRWQFAGFCRGRKFHAGSANGELLVYFQHLARALTKHLDRLGPLEKTMRIAVTVLAILSGRRPAHAVDRSAHSVTVAPDRLDHRGLFPRCPVARIGIS